MGNIINRNVRMGIKMFHINLVNAVWKSCKHASNWTKVGLSSGFANQQQVIMPNLKIRNIGGIVGVLIKFKFIWLNSSLLGVKENLHDFKSTQNMSLDEIIMPINKLFYFNPNSKV